MRNPTEQLLNACSLNRNEIDYDLLCQAIKAGGDVNIQDEYGRTPLYLSVLQLDDKAIRLLIDHGANVNHVTPNGDTSLQQSVCLENFNSLQLLIRAGADLQYCDPYGDTPLHNCVIIGWLEGALFLLKSGADPNYINLQHGYTAMHYVSEYRFNSSTDFVHALLEYGADPFICAENGKKAEEVVCLEAKDALEQYRKRMEEIQVLQQTCETPDSVHNRPGRRI